jgi:osmotically-inducible protein OsmY
MAMIKRFLKKVTRLSFWGAAIGAVVYFFDPRSGRGRRTRTKDQVQAKLRRTAQQAEQTASHVGNKAEGVARTVASPTGQAPDDDKTLVDKIKSEVLGGTDFAGHDVVVDAVDGVVTLRGQVERPEHIEELTSAVQKVPGVNQVENYLHLPGESPPNKEESLES